MAIGKELKRIRFANSVSGRPMSVAKLAGYLSVTPGKLRKWEDYDTNPKKADIKIIEDYFRIGIEELPTIGKFKFYTKEITKENTNDRGRIVYESVKLEKLIGQMQEKFIRMEAVQKILFQEIAEIRAKANKTSFSRESLELSRTIDAESDRLFSELQKKSK